MACTDAERCGITNFDAIADQIESMVRLGSKSKGLGDRRIREAQIIRAAGHKYDPSAVVRV